MRSSADREARKAAKVAVKKLREGADVGEAARRWDAAAAKMIADIDRARRLTAQDFSIRINARE